MFVLLCWVSTAEQQSIDDVLTALVYRDHQGRQAIFILHMNIGLFDEEVIHHALMAILDRVHESRP